MGGFSRTPRQVNIRQVRKMPALKPTSPPTEPDSTLDYYEAHARDYAEATLSIDMGDLYDRFLAYLPQGGRILDAGSGSGRDTLAFLHKGYQVEAFDASPALAELSSRLTGVRTEVIRFQDFQSAPRFDGVWACASLLHVPQTQLPDAVRRLIDALKPSGALFISVKHGVGERVAREGRLFTDLDEPGVRQLLKPFDSEIKELWISEGQGARRGKDRWLNVIAVKRTGHEH
jgi:SAM-dependent methyltransferase